MISMGRHFLVRAAPAPDYGATRAIRLVAAHVTSRARTRQWVTNDYFAWCGINGGDAEK
jgi:hypothetical protein